MDPNELKQVRQIIERSTSKVSLRDLERKGFRKVKVLRSSDIDRMIRQAVADAIATGGEDREQLIAQSRAALQKQMAETKRQVAEAKQADEELTRLRLAHEEAARHNQELRTRLAEAEERARGSEGLRAQAQTSAARLATLEERARAAEERAKAVPRLQTEADQLRARASKLEMEKRLTDELEIPKLRQRIADLEVELKAAKEASRGQPVGGDDLRALLREVVAEVGAGKSAGADVAQEFARLHAALSGLGGGERKAGIGLSSDHAATAVRLSLDELFAKGEADMETNIQNIKLKETTTKGVGSSLDKLRNLRKNLGG